MSGDVAAIKERLEAATPGPWEAVESAGDEGVWWVERRNVSTVAIDLMGADAAFIAHAPADLRWLLDALAEAEAERDTLAARHDLAALRDRALAAEAKVARVEALIEGAGDGNLKTSHLRAALETNIEDAYERGRVHAEDDAYRRIRAALEEKP